VPIPPPVPVARLVVSLIATPTYVTPEGSVTAICVVQSGKISPRQWIGLYPVGAEVSKYTAYIVADASREYAFKAPSGPGEYAFRVLGDPPPKPQVDLQSGAASVKCGAEIPVRWSVYTGRRSAKDWIGLYTPGAKNEDFLTWKYVADADQGGLVLKAPDQPGI